MVAAGGGVGEGIASSGAHAPVSTTKIKLRTKHLETLDTFVFLPLP
jgi:hypothetical protein